MADLSASVCPTIGSGLLLGSITGAVKDHILRKLPDNYIKTTYIKNSFPSISEAHRSDDDMMTKAKPTLSLNLQYAPQDANVLNDHLAMALTRIPLRAYSYSKIYANILSDNTDFVYISSVAERLKLNYEIGIRVDSETQAFNLLGYMRSYIGVKRPYYMHGVILEVPIPNECLAIVIKAKLFDVKTPLGIQTFHTYLYQKSGGRISYKRNASSGRYNYFMKYKTNVLCNIVDMPSIDKTTEGKSTIDAQIKFNMEVEFNNYTNFITEFDKLVDLTIPADINSDMNAVIYNFTFPKLLLNTDNMGRTLTTVLDFVTDANTALDVTEFGPDLNSQLHWYIDYLIQAETVTPGIMASKLNLLVFRDHQLIQDTVDYTVDWSLKHIRMTSAFLNYVYRLGVYVDLVHYNEIMDIRNLANTIPTTESWKVKDINI